MCSVEHTHASSADCGVQFASYSSFSVENGLV